MKLEVFKDEVSKILADNIHQVPIGSGKFITIKDIDVSEPKYGLDEELDIKLSGQTYGANVRATFELKDTETGTTETKKARIFKLPVRTSRGTYIFNGNEVNIKNQYRRRPGIYTTYSQSAGGLYESSFNMSKGRAQFSGKVRVVINPVNLKYELRVKDSKFDLYTILKVYGFSDNEIKNLFQDQKVFEANTDSDIDAEAIKIAKRFTGEKYKTFEEAAAAIKQEFGEISFKKSVNEYTIGRNHDKISKDFWHDVVVKLREVAGGRMPPDDAEASYFREYLEPEDNIIESIKSTATSIVKKIKQRKGKGDLGAILQNINFDQDVNNIFSRGSLKDIRDQTNPVDWAFGVDALTIYGPGGIGESRSVTDAMRRLQPSLIGFADPINTPEDGDKVGVVLHRTVNSVIKDRIPYIKVTDKNGHKTSIPVLQFYHSKVGIGTPRSGKIGIIHKGEVRTGTVSEAQYFIEESGLFSHTSNMIPMISSTYGVRANVGSKQLGQALPLKNPDEPFVESEYMKNRKVRTLEQGFDMDEFGNVRSVDAGTVEKVSEKSGKITIKHEDGSRRTYDIPKNFPLNSESFMDATIQVSAGDTVKKGQVIAESIFSRGGGLAIGKNLKTAFLPYKGYNFEDGFVLSETAAKNLTSVHMHKFLLEKSPNIVVDKKKFAATFPNRAAKYKLANYDDSGVIREGVTLNYGDPVVLAFERRELTPQQTIVASFNKTMASLLQPREASVFYDIDFPGVVARVYVDSSKVHVMVKSEEPAVEGDKIATRYGGKGIITKILPDPSMPQDESGQPIDVLFNPSGLPCYDDQTEFLTNNGWIPAPLLSEHHQVATIHPQTKDLTFEKPEEIVHLPYQGKMYKIVNQQLDLLVTPDHKMFVATKEGVDVYGLESAKDIFGKPRRYLVARQNADEDMQDIKLFSTYVNWSEETKRNQIEEFVDYEGNVHCATVPHGTLVVRRNGKIAVSGNSRMNSSQIVENALGKISAKTGKKYAMPGFDSRSFTEIAKKELEDNNISDEEIVLDPETGKKMPRVGVGNMYFMKLKHSVRTKLKAGDVGEYDTLYDQPKKTERSTARGIDGLSLYSLLASGARHNLADMANIKSSRNDEFWRALQQGLPTPPPKETTTSKHFMAVLSGMGLNVNRTKDSLSVLPAVDKDILKKSNGEIAEAKYIRSRDLKPEPGGFYDPIITGGVKGERWSHIDIKEPIPNPLFEEPIKAVLGLTKDKFYDILEGKIRVNGKGEIDENGQFISGRAFRAMLNGIDVDSKIKEWREQSKKAVQEKDWPALDSLNKKLRIAQNSKQLGQKLGDLYVISKIPVIPPRFRQMIQLHDGTVQNPPINELYGAIKLESDGLKTVQELGLDDQDEMAKRVSSLYGHVAAAFGLKDPLSYALKAREEVVGLMDQLAPRNKQSKYGFIGKRLLNKPQNLSGGSTIVVDPELPMDEVGIPKSMAKKVYKPFIMRKLVQVGYSPLEAIKAIEEDHLIAIKKLEEIMKERPVLVNRHPSLHKYNFLSQWPKLVSGNAIHLNPLVTGGFNADFDGDSSCASVFVLDSRGLNDNSGNISSQRRSQHCSSSSGEILIDYRVCSSYDMHMPTTNKLIANRVLHLSDFPHNPQVTVTEKGVLEYDVPEGIFVPSYKDGQFEMRPVTKYTVHPNCEEWKITTGKGSEIICSPHHSLATFDEETMSVVMTDAESSDGKCIPVLRSMQTTDPHRVIVGGELHGTTGNKKKVELETTFDSGWFVGTMIGDGWDSGGRQINIAYGRGAEELLFRWQVLAERYRPDNKGNKFTTTQGNPPSGGISYITTAGSAALARFFNEAIGHGAVNKHLPEGFMDMPLEFRRGLFAGLIDTDGTMCWTKGSDVKKPQFMCSFTTISPRLSEEVVLLGLTLGISSSVKDYQKDPIKFPGYSKQYIITFSTRHIQDASWIKLWSPQKQKALDRLRSEPQIMHGQYEIVPLTSDVRKELCSHLVSMGATKRPKIKKNVANGDVIEKVVLDNPEFNPTARSMWVVLQRAKTYISRESAEKLNQMVKPELRSAQCQKWFDVVLNPSVGWDVITSAEKTGNKIQMYDLTVPDAWTFVLSNGAVVWDSMIGNITLSFPEQALVDPSGGVIEMMPSTMNIADFPKGALKEEKDNKRVYHVKEPVYVPSISAEGVPSMKRVTEFHEHDGCTEWLVSILGHNEPLRLSGDHSLTCYNPEAMRLEKYTPQASIGMAVPKICGYSVEHPLPFHDVLSRNKKDRMDLISSLGFFVGLMHYVRGREGYSFTSNGFLEDRIRRLSEITAAEKDGNYVKCPEILEWIDRHVFRPTGPRMPSWLLMTADDERAAFSAGFLESLIYVKHYQGVAIRYHPSLDFVRDAGRVLGSIGIDSKVKEAFDKRRNLHYYELDISVPDVRTLVMTKPEFFSPGALKYIHQSPIMLGSLRRQDIVPVPTWISMFLQSTLAPRVGQMALTRKLRITYQFLTFAEWVEKGYEMWQRSVLMWAIGQLTDEEVEALPDEFLRMAHNENIRWGFVRGAKPLRERKCTMYDLTVEDNYNFALDSGYVVWDTMNIHVPVSEGARIEAAKELLPSKFLFGPDRKVMPMPSNEAMLGLYLMSKAGNEKNQTFASIEAAEAAFKANEIELNDVVSIAGKKTSLGKSILNSCVPSRYAVRIDSANVVDKKFIQKLIREIYEDSPTDAANTLNKLKDAGYKYSYLYGFSISLKDFMATKEMKQYAKETVDQLGDDPENDERLASRLRLAENKFSKFFDENRVYDMARSGAKGGWNNISQMLLAPGFVEGPGGMVSKRAVKTGYAEGMDPEDYLNTLYAARSGIISKVLGVSKGGELAKNEVHTTVEIVITEKDCGTKRGVPMSRDDSYIIGRYAAESGQEINDHYLKTHLAKEIIVRSPLTCEADKGICAKCYGKNDQFKVPKIGDHVGIDAAQSATERITQSLLRAFHGGRGAKDSGSMDLAKHMHNLFGKMPKTFAEEAPVALQSGTVKKIDRSPAGGYDIYVDDKKYHASDRVKPVVTVGSRVEQGEALTTGVKNPRSILESSGLYGVRTYLRDSMRELYQSTGVDMNPVHFEVVGRGLTEHARVTDPGNSNYEYGDLETIATLDKENKRKGSEIKYQPILAGADRIPVLRKDFLAQAARREPKRGIITAASEGRKSDIHGVNPLSSWMLGEFRSTPDSKGEY